MTIEFTPVATVLNWSLQDWLDKYGADGLCTMLVRYMESKARMRENQAKRQRVQKALKATLERVAKERGLTVDQLMNVRVDMATGEKVTGNEKPAAGEQSRGLSLDQLLNERVDMGTGARVE